MKVLGGGEGLAKEVADDGGLEAGDEVQGLLIAEGGGGFEVGAGGEELLAGGDGGGHRVGLDVAEDGSFDAGEGEVEAGWSVGVGVLAGLDGVEVEGDGFGVAVGGEGVDPGAAGVAEAEELGDLVEGFAGGVVDGAADVRVGPGAGLGVLAGEVEVGVASRDDEG